MTWRTWIVALVVAAAMSWAFWQYMGSGAAGTGPGTGVTTQQKEAR